MAKGRLTLRDRANADGTHPVILSYKVGNTPYRVTTGKSITKKHWNPLSPDSPVKSSHNDADSLNAFLRSLLGKFNRIIDDYVLKHGESPSVLYVRSQWEKDKNENTTSFEYLYKQFLRRKAKKSGVDIKLGTFENNHKVLLRLQEFTTDKRLELSFEAITYSFINDFQDWLVKERKNAPNSVGTIFRNLRTFLKWAQEFHDVKVNEKVIRAMPCLKEQKWRASLDMGEMELIAGLDLSHNELWERCRDICLIQFNIGGRISDVYNLLKGQGIVFENGQPYYKYTDKKTGGLHSVQLFPFVYSIIKKRLNTPVSWIPPEQVINEKIKLICAFAGIDEMVSIKKMNRQTGEYEEKQVPKWSAISTHTFRISLINILLDMGESLSTISGITGQSHATLLGYMHKSKKAVTKALSSINENLSRGAMKVAK